MGMLSSLPSVNTEGLESAHGERYTDWVLLIDGYEKDVGVAVL